MNRTVIISKDKTLIIKGFAILMMIAHHCWIKEFFVKPPEILSYYPMIKLDYGMKMCVGLFTFFVGYGFFHAKNVDARYVFRHIWRLCRKYWLILSLTILFSLIGGGKSRHIILNIPGISHEYNLANWYIYFYIYSMILLPFISSFLRKMRLYHLVMLVLICGSLTYINTSKNIYMVAMRECTAYTPMLLVGYYCANTKILSNASIYIQNRWTWILIALMAFAGRCGLGSVKGLVTDVIFVPVFVIAISAIFDGFENSKTAKMLTSFGACSTMMWFIHTLPFNDATRAIFQGSIFWTNNIIVLFIVVTVLSYLFALLYNKLSLPQTKK